MSYNNLIIMYGVLIFWTLSPFYNNTHLGAHLEYMDSTIVFKDGQGESNSTEREETEIYEQETLQGDPEPNTDSDMDMDMGLDQDQDYGPLNRVQPRPPLYSSLNDYPVQERQEGETNSLAGNTAISDLASESDFALYRYAEEYRDIELTRDAQNHFGHLGLVPPQTGVVDRCRDTFIGWAQEYIQENYISQEVNPKPTSALPELWTTEEFPFVAAQNRVDSDESTLEGSISDTSEHSQLSLFHLDGDTLWYLYLSIKENPYLFQVLFLLLSTYIFIFYPNAPFKMWENLNINVLNNNQRLLFFLRIIIKFFSLLIR